MTFKTFSCYFVFIFITFCCAFNTCFNYFVFIFITFCSAFNTFFYYFVFIFMTFLWATQIFSKTTFAKKFPTLKWKPFVPKLKSYSNCKFFAHRNMSRVSLTKLTLMWLQNMLSKKYIVEKYFQKISSYFFLRIFFSFLDSLFSPFNIKDLIGTTLK